MYAGHAALALVLKARRPDVPMLPLALSCYAPDFVDLAVATLWRQSGSAVWSHSLPAIVIGAVIAGALATLAMPRAAAAVVAMGWLLHWPLDFVTGLKPLIGASPTVGLDLYHHPYLDLVVESLLVLASCVVFAKRFAPRAPERRVVVLLGGSLLVMQLMATAMISNVDGRGWNPSLALVK